MLRVFERGGEKRSEIGNPNTDEPAGQPDLKLSNRGLGTNLRTDPVFLGLQKTRLLDPLLSFPGTNDQPGDYRASGCSACHVLYANDRDPSHGEQTSAFGNTGRSISNDPTIDKSESGHPLQHVFTKQIPSSQCMTCHVHPGTNMVTTYYGYTWWDNEADGEKMYPAKQHDPSLQEQHDVSMRNPEGSAARGNWGDPKFLQQIGTPAFNADLKDTKFADFHSHGWVFRAVYKRDRHGHLLDQDGNLLPDTSDALGKAVHLEDIHLEKGMQCIDCHFTQDVHGNGKLYGETRNAVEIGCVDCHGTIYSKATLKTSGPASAGDVSSNLLRLRTPFKQARFYWQDGKLCQRSNVVEGRQWEVVQTLDSITPGNPHYSEKSRLAKTMQKDGVTWGHVDDMQKLAHADSRMTCYSCHSSWTTSCFGCHLSMTANQKTPMLHNEGETTRNYTNYNFMVLRDDVYMLGVDGTVTGNKIAPVRSACAVVVSSQNANRNWLYQQQQTISAPGFSGEAFSTYVPHTVRATETKGCTDCHVSRNGDNNAWMAQLLVQGTNFLNFMGKYIYVADGREGFAAVPIAESTEPPAVMGSDLQHLAYPSDYAKFRREGPRAQDRLHARRRRRAGRATARRVPLRRHGRGRLPHLRRRQRGRQGRLAARDHRAGLAARPALLPQDEVRHRGRLALHAGARPAAHADSRRTKSSRSRRSTPSSTSPTSTKASSSSAIPRPASARCSTATRATTSSSAPRPSIPRANSNGARRITIAGTYAYILCDRGLEVVDLADPLHPKITAEIGRARTRRAHRRRRAVPLRLRHRPRGPEGLRRHSPRRPAPRRRHAAARRRAQHLCRAHLCVRLGGSKRHRHRRRRDSRSSRSSTRSSTPAARSTM